MIEFMYVTACAGVLSGLIQIRRETKMRWYEIALISLFWPVLFGSALVESHTHRRGGI